MRRTWQKKGIFATITRAMLKENWRSIARIERIADTVLIVVAFFVAYYGRASLIFWDQYFGWEFPFAGPALAPLKDYFIVLLLALTLYTVTLSFMGAYSSMRLSSSWTLLRISVVSSLVVFIALAAALFLLKINLSRSFIILFCSLVALSLAAERFVVLRILRFWRRRGKNFRNIIICGIGEQALRLLKELLSRPELGIRIRGFADLRSDLAADDRSREWFKEHSRHFVGIARRVIVGVDALKRALPEYAVDEVIFTDVVEVMPEVEEMILTCSEQGVRTTIAADLFSIGLVKSGISYFGGMPLIHFQTPPGDRWELSVKRLLDIAVSGLLLLLLLPLFIIIGAGVKISSPGPMLFKQRRVGFNGRLFFMYKFRSMYVDAEQDLAKLRDHNEMRGPVFKMKDDPRITPFGRLLRRFSLDELPQLWNVFIGEMSLVGPRPAVPGEVSMYERKDRRRLSMRPGLTCSWQVSGRNEIEDFDSWVKLDLHYIDNWSLGQDFLLLVRTIPAVIFGAGAR